MLEDKQLSYYRLQDEHRRTKAELNHLKHLVKGNPQNWYTLYLQEALSTIERQYEQLQEDFHALNTKFNKEMEKRQYIFPKSSE